MSVNILITLVRLPLTDKNSSCPLRSASHLLTKVCIRVCVPRYKMCTWVWNCLHYVILVLHFLPKSIFLEKSVHHLLQYVFTVNRDWYYYVLNSCPLHKNYITLHKTFTLHHYITHFITLHLTLHKKSNVRMLCARFQIFIRWYRINIYLCPIHRVTKNQHEY
jgi:hypothetical protein